MFKRITKVAVVLIILLLSQVATAMAVTVSPAVSVGVYADGADFYNLGKKLYISDRSNDQVLVYKGTSLYKTISVGDYPTGIAVDQVAKKVYVVNQAAKTVSIIDATTDTVTGTWNLPGSDTPFAITVNSATNKIYIADYGYWEGGVIVIDATTGSITKMIAMAQKGPWSIKANSTTNKIYVAQYYGDEVHVINGSTDTDTGSVGTLSRPSFIAINETTNRIYVCGQYGYSDTPLVINGATGVSANAPFYATSVAIDETNAKMYASYGGGMRVYSATDHSEIQGYTYTDVVADYSFWSPYEAMAYVYSPSYDKLATVQDGTPLAEPSAEPPVSTTSTPASSIWSLTLVSVLGMALLVFAQKKQGE